MDDRQEATGQNAAGESFAALACEWWAELDQIVKRVGVLERTWAAGGITRNAGMLASVLLTLMSVRAALAQSLANGSERGNGLKTEN